MNIFLFSAILLFATMSALFVLAVRLKDNSIVDIAYGAVFVLLAWSAWTAFGAYEPRAFLMLALVTVWGIRLALHIAARKRGEKGEDFRYRKWRESWGETFYWRSFLQVFMLQGSVIFAVSLPVLLVVKDSGPGLGWLDITGTAVWAVGFFFEAVGDWQLLKFKRNTANSGKLIQHGLWKYTRHPNYFGEATLWWGVFLIALNVPFGYLSVISPLLIGFLLFKVSGIPMLEAKYEGRPDFEEYKKRTNALFPWFPRETKEGDDAR
ncbi:MAG: DUF1295 domain-containing protein [Pyrinomonadaceae bacterium]